MDSMAIILFESIAIKRYLRCNYFWCELYEIRKVRGSFKKSLFLSHRRNVPFPGQQNLRWLVSIVASSEAHCSLIVNIPSNIKYGTFPDSGSNNDSDRHIDIYVFRKGFHRFSEGFSILSYPWIIYKKFFRHYQLFRYINSKHSACRYSAYQLFECN